MFPYRWRLSDGFPAESVRHHGLKVFGTFICGGGSSMGYKLAGFEHIGGVEIDPKVAQVYQDNLTPKYLYIEDLRDFNERDDLPEELYNLDILDGSPPCTTFSMAGDRESSWGKEKKFAEGSISQRLDDLVFIYCDTIGKLRPKTAILENVSGIVKGNAKVYAKEIVGRLEAYGYEVQTFLLNAATMGVPQSRERVFFVARRKDTGLPPLLLEFDGEPILFGEIRDKNSGMSKPLSPKSQEIWDKAKRSSNSGSDALGIVSHFNDNILHNMRICPTLSASALRAKNLVYNEPRTISQTEAMLASTFPLDYQFTTKSADFILGMCVPPVMIAQIAYQMYLQWFDRVGS